MALRAVLPAAMAARIDFQSLTPQLGTFVDEALSGSQTDLLYTVEYADQEVLLVRPHGTQK